MEEPYLPFFSEIAAREHIAYRRLLSAKLSLLQKSFPGRGNLTAREIALAGFRGAERETVALAREIVLHDVFFSSFSAKQGKVPAALHRYSSDAAFRYDLFLTAKGARDGFLCVFCNRRGDACFEIASPPDFRLTVLPRLAVDLAEHAYFYDFGFDQERYLSVALSCLDLSKL